MLAGRSPINLYELSTPACCNRHGYNQGSWMLYKTDSCLLVMRWIVGIHGWRLLSFCVQFGRSIHHGQILLMIMIQVHKLLQIHGECLYASLIFPSIGKGNFCVINSCFHNMRLLACNATTCRCSDPKCGMVQFIYLIIYPTLYKGASLS